MLLNGESIHIFALEIWRERDLRDDSVNIEDLRGMLLNDLFLF